MQEKELYLKNVLIESEKGTLSPQERNVLFQLCKQGIPDEYREALWMKATNALSMKFENKEYYDKLCSLEMEYPNPCFHQIEIDMYRTFPEDKLEKGSEFLAQLATILSTYIKRNPSIGYC